MRDEPMKILIIEDNPGDARLLQEVFMEADSRRYELTHIERLGEALKRLNYERFDLIFLDLSLPDGQGFETLERTHVHASGIPIIVLTGTDDDTLAVKALKRGAQDYLVKGQVNGNLLVRATRYAIERYRLLAQMEEAMKLKHHMAYHDSLTDLPNRQLFYDRLHHAIVQAKRYGYELALLFLDLDRFKPINDSLGHNTGDLLLKAVAQRLRDCIRESDTVARLGGDEFTVVLTQIMQMLDAARVAQKILNELSKPYVIDGNELIITTSIGISLYPNDGSDNETLVKHADRAMYRAKSEGCNNYQFYNASFDAAVNERLELENSLRNAIEKDELVLHYQPQVDLNTNKIIGVEALVRWQHPEFGLLTPSDFISLAEETGLIVPLGEWVLRTGCEQTKAWQQLGLPLIRIAINLSARQFRVLRLKEIVDQVLVESSLSPNYLVLEITESNAMQNVEYTFNTLNTLKEMGVQISMDDFGTGYASLNYLKRFPLDILKIDRSFVNGLHEDWAIVSAIIAMAHRLKLKVLAEGVEHAEQIKYLQSLKCDEFQGFYFSRPVPAESFARLFQSEERLI